MPTFGPDIFVRLGREILGGTAVMTRRSDSDKEYFLQDWFSEVLRGNYRTNLQGRNSRPDFLVENEGFLEGYELKCLANVREGNRDPSVTPCRTDVDFNSGIPCGYFNRMGRRLRCYYLFVLYENIPNTSNLQVNGIAMVLTDGNFLNRDFDLAEGHRNISEDGFGSYEDGFIRIRKMYRFPNPLAEPSLRYTVSLVTEDSDVEENCPDLEFSHILNKRSSDGNDYSFYVYKIR